MKTRTAIPIAIVALLLLGAVGLRQAQATTPAQSSGHDPPTWYTVEPGTASGGGYHLTSLDWQVSGTAGGRGYRLLGPAAPTLRGNGCCCTWIPSVMRNY